MSSSLSGNESRSQSNLRDLVDEVPLCKFSTRNLGSRSSVELVMIRSESPSLSPYSSVLLPFRSRVLDGMRPSTCVIVGLNNLRLLLCPSSRKPLDSRATTSSVAAEDNDEEDGLDETSTQDSV